MINKVFSIGLSVGDPSDLTRIVKDTNISAIPQDEILSGIVGSIYEFLMASGYSIKDSYEMFSHIGTALISDSIDNPSDEEFEEIDKIVDDIAISQRKEMESTIEDLVNSQTNLNKFIQDVINGDDNFKKTIFKAFLQSMSKE